MQLIFKNVGPSKHTSNQKNNRLHKAVVPMIFHGARCLRFCITSHAILQFYHLQLQIKIFLFIPPENEAPRGRQATRLGETPLRRAFKHRWMNLEASRSSPPQGWFPKHSPANQSSDKRRVARRDPKHSPANRSSDKRRAAQPDKAILSQILKNL